MDDVSKHCTMGFKKEGDLVVLLGVNTDELGGSAYLKEVLDIEGGPAPRLNLDEELKVQACCLEAIKQGLVSSAHDISDGGLAVALAECCIAGQLGFEGEIESEVRPDALLFGEAQSRIIVSLVEEKLPELKKLAEEMNVKVSVLGTVKSDKNLNISVKTKGQVAGIIDVSIDEIAEISNNAIKRRVEYV